jgi:hypothetical protein
MCLAMQPIRAGLLSVRATDNSSVHDRTGPRHCKTQPVAGLIVELTAQSFDASTDWPNDAGQSIHLTGRWIQVGIQLIARR